MHGRGRFVALVALILCAGAPAARAQVSIVRVTFTPTGVIDMLPTSVSDDGNTVVGVGPFGTPNLLYTEGAGASVIGDGCPSGIPAVSGDGSTIVGCNTDVNGKWNAAKWLGGTSWLDLGSEAGAVPCDFFLSGPWALTRDGSIATGLLYKAQLCKASAGTWDLVAGGPATPLPVLVQGRASRGNDISADGSVVVGWQDQFTGLRTAAKWVNGVGEFITDPKVDFLGEALAVSADGKTIVGVTYDFTNAGWIWHEGEGVSPITSNVDGDYVPVDVSADGRKVVGIVRDPQTGIGTAFIWSKSKGLEILEDFLKIRNVDVPPGWTFSSLSVISGDGKTLYGWGFNPNDLIEMFKIEIGNPVASMTFTPFR